MLTAFIHNIQTADNLLRSASALARDLKKELGVLCYADNEDRAKEYAFSKPYARLEVPLFFNKNISGISGPESA